MGFSISSPDLEALAARMESADLTAAYTRAAADVGSKLEADLARAYREAGATDELVDTVGTYVHKDDTVYTGIPGSSRQAASAHEFEYGTPYIAPHAPLRQTVAAQAAELGQEFGKALDREIGQEIMP